MSGIFATYASGPVGGTITGTWTIPPRTSAWSNCYGKTVYAYAAALWSEEPNDRADGHITSVIDDSITDSSPVDGSFTFVETITCKVYDAHVSCPGECIFYMSSDTNAHAESCDISSSYPRKLCCEVPGRTLTVSIADGCGSDACVLSLFSKTNSHVEECGGSYTNDTCLSLDTGTIDCRYEDNACTGGYSPVASISARTNAHVAEYSAYTRKICCRIE